MDNRQGNKPLTAPGRASRGLTLTDILVTVVIAVVFGIVYRLWSPLYALVSPLGIQLEELIYGMWFIAAIVAFLIIRKPGIALIAETAAASGEWLAGSEWGLQVLMFGIVQGLGAELVFAAFRYKVYNLTAAILAGLASCAGSLFLGIFTSNLLDLEPWALLVKIGARAAGSILIAGIFAYYLVKALEATGVTNLLRPASREDYQSLDR